MMFVVPISFLIVSFGLVLIPTWFLCADNILNKCKRGLVTVEPVYMLYPYIIMLYVNADDFQKTRWTLSADTVVCCSKFNRNRNYIILRAVCLCLFNENE